MRSLSTLLAAGLGLLAHAQVTISHGQLPTGTFTDRLYLVTSQGSAQMPTDGVGQTWDLSSATLMDIGTFTHRPAAGTPYAADHPTADLAWHMDMGFLGNNYTYLSSSTSALNMVATDVPEDPNVFSDAMQVMAFPLSYNGSFTDTWVDGEGNGTLVWTYSGSGTAITSVGTFTNVVKMSNDDGDVVLWRTSPLVPLLLSMNGTLLAVGPVATGVAEHQAGTLSVYPVPCTDRLVVQSTAPAPWRMLDAQGRVVAEGRTTGIGATELFTDGLRPGAYALQLLDPAGPRLARFVKQ